MTEFYYEFSRDKFRKRCRFILKNLAPAALLLALSILSINGQADGTRGLNETDKKIETVAALPVAVTAPSLTKTTPSTFVVPISVGDVTGNGILAFQFNIVYNPSVIDPSGTNFGCSTVGTLAETANLTATCNVQPDGVLRVAVSGTGSMTGSGTILKLNFATDPSAAPGNTSPLAFQNMFFFNGGGPVTTNPTNGQITIVGTTAANVSIGGRVLSATGQPIGKAKVLMTEASGNVRVTFSSPLGYYHFDDVAVGQNYFLSVSSKTFVFEPRSLAVMAELPDLDLIALP
jgi:Cohesin domain